VVVSAPAAEPRISRNPRENVPLSLRQRLLWSFVRWYAHVELPRYGYLLDWWGLNNQPLWNGAPTVVVRERLHGMKVRLNMADFFQRINYFFGCWHELDVMTTVTHALRPGDAVVDGGANAGLVTIHMAALVGPAGEVIAFEPGALQAAACRWHLQVNELTNVTLHELGLSDEEGEATFKVMGFDNFANGTLGPVPERFGSDVSQVRTVRIVRGDDFADPDDPRPLLIKLDIEGFEERALRGLMRTIERRRPAIMPEVNGEMLELNGSSAEAVHDLLAPLGYRPWALDRGGFRSRHRLHLHPLTREQVRLEKDLIFLRPDGPHWARLEKLFQPPGRYWRHHRLAEEAAKAARG
jgi:FkbM family methyltransferase